MVKTMEECKVSFLRKALKFLLLLREPVTTEQLQNEFGVSGRTIRSWMKAAKEVIPIRKDIEYHTGGQGKRTVTYMWGGNYCLSKTYGPNGTFRTLDSCLLALGATVDEVRAHKKSMGTIDYRMLVDSLFRDRITQHKPSESNPNVVRSFIEARERAHHILKWRGR